MGRQLFEYQPTVGYRFIPDLKARVDHESGGYLVRVNGAGFRNDREFVPGKDGATFRVLLFGDSFTAGDAVSNSMRYGDLLEGLVPGLEVYNFGLPGSGTDQQYLIWREFAQGIDHDLVILGVQVGNIRRVAARYRPYHTQSGEQVVLAKPYFNLRADGSLELHHVPVPKAPIPEDQINADHIDGVGRLRRLRRVVNNLGPRAKNVVRRMTRYQGLPAYDDTRHSDWRLMRAILERWIAEIQTPVIVAPLPIYPYVEQTASATSYQQRFRELHDPPRVVVHDPLSDFHAVPRSERRGLRFEHDPHPTPEYHRVLAESLATCLRPFVQRQEAL